MFEYVVTEPDKCKECLRASAGNMLTRWSLTLPAGQPAERVYGRLHDWVWEIRPGWAVLDALFTCTDISPIFSAKPTSRAAELEILKYV